MNHASQLQEAHADAKKGDWTQASAKCLAILRENPRDADAAFLYGQLAEALEHFHEAIVIYQKLLAINPDTAQVHDRLAYLNHKLADSAKAVMHAKSALRLDPRMVGPHLVLGAILLEQNKDSEAAHEFETARSLATDSLEVEVAYVEALLVIADFDRAATILRELITRYPEKISLYTMLTRSRKFQQDDPDVHTIRSLLNQDGELKPWLTANIRDHFDAHMVLFRLESDLGNLDNAFHHLKKAKDINKTLTPHDPEKSAQYSAKIREVFSAEFLRQHAAAGSTAPDAIFVVGMPRSGTTLLERLLSSHQDVVAAGELPHVSRIIQELCARLGSNQYDLTALQRVPDESWREIGEEYIRRARQQHSLGKHFIDKMPSNFLYLGFIRAMLPAAKIVHISRHPMANCLSIYEQDFRARHPYCNDLRWTGLEYLEYRQMMDHWRSQFGDKIIEIKYEDLVSKPAEIIHELGEQLGLELPADGAAMAQAQSQGTIRTASMWQARQPIHTGSMTRWEQLQDHLQPLQETLAPILKPPE